MNILLRKSVRWKRIAPVLGQFNDIHYKTPGVLKNRLPFPEIGKTERLPQAVDSAVMWKTAMGCSVEVMQGGG